MTGITRNDCVLLELPLTATAISAFPATRLLGTGTTIVVSFQDEGVAETPPNVIVLVPCTDPKFAPCKVTDAPTGDGGPTVGEMLLILGAICAQQAEERNSTAAILNVLLLPRVTCRIA
jgi:hypothetical protein